MWRVSGKRIFPRWHKIRQNPTKPSNKKPEETNSELCVIAEKRQSSDNGGWKQHAHRQQSFWNDPIFHNHALCNRLLETVGLVGTAAFCLDLQHRHCKSARIKKNDNACVFSRLAYAMPFGPRKKSSCSIASESNSVAAQRAQSKEVQKKPQKTDIAVASKAFHSVTMNSVASIENAIGVMFLEHDDKQAFEFFKASAKLGCPKGLYNLGLCYETGRGTNKNLTKAAHYYKAAASRDHSFAIYNLAVYTLKGLGGISQNLCEGVRLLKDAAERGITEAQLSLGMYYLEEEKYDEAYKMFRESAQSNDIDGKYYLGLCYENGWGVESNDAVALELFAQAARKGHDEATLKLGHFFETGSNGMDPDAEFSMTLYRMLADKGHKGGEHAMQALKTKAEGKWKLKSPTVDEPPNKALDKPSSPIHTSLSVPEFRNYSSYCKIEHSKSSLLHSMLSLHKMHPEFSDESETDPRNAHCHLDLPGRSTVRFHVGMPQTVLANS